jgi:hypothetical protein
MRAVRNVFVMPLASLLVLRSLAAQDASPYVPLNHWAMPYIEHLIVAGVIADPTPLTRPLKESDIVRALTAADTTNVGGSVRSTIRRLRREFPPAERGYRVDAALGAAAATQAVRDPLELGRGIPPRSIDRRAFASAGFDLKLLFGPLLAVTHPVVDTRLQYDPDWYAKADNSTRFAEAYVSGQWRPGELFFGILDRNWGPSGVQGVVVSDNPYSMDHLHVTLGGRGIQLQSMATQLNTLFDSTGAPVNRYMMDHRLWIHPHERWTLALWQGAVTSGVGRQLEPWYLNLVTLSVFRASNGTSVNSFWGVDVERRAAVTLFGQFMLDDIQVSRKKPNDLKPASYAFTIGAKGRAGRGKTATWMLFYTQVATLTYRNEDDLQVPLYFGLGTGRNFDDYDQATAKLSLILRPALALEPEITLLRQGTGDPHLPHPLPPQYPSTAVLFQGVVTRTVRLALGGSWQLGGMSVTGNGGVHLVHNAAHVPGASTTQWVGSIGLTYRIHHRDVLP